MPAEIAKLMEGAQVKTGVQYQGYILVLVELSCRQADANIYCCHDTGMGEKNKKYTTVVFVPVDSGNDLWKIRGFMLVSKRPERARNTRRDSYCFL